MCSEVTLLETFDWHLAGQVYYRCLLLALINIRIAKLGVCIVHWLLEVCTKVGGDWAWPSGYGDSSVPPNSSLPVRHRYRPLRPNFGEPRHESLPKQITNLGGRSQKSVE